MAGNLVVMKVIPLFCALNIVGLVTGQQQAGVIIVEPKPKNVYAIELEATDVQSTVCIARDLNVTHPTKALGFNFYKIDAFGNASPRPLESNDVFTFSNKSRENGTVALGTMTVKNASMSVYGTYQCWATPGNARHGFTVLVIPRTDLPEIFVNVTQISATFDDVVTLMCNLTKQGTIYTKLTRMEWLKGGKVISRILHPKEDKLKPLTIKIKKPEEAGTFTCRLTSLLRSVRTYNVSKNIKVTVAPKSFAEDLDDNEIIRKKGEKVALKCEVKGNPIIVEWQREDPSGNRTAVNNPHYTIQSKTPYDGFELVINETEYSDRGDYWCCVKDNSTGNYKLCQRFTLRVKDPLGWLWPLLGIIAEVLVLVIIIVVFELYRKKKDDSFEKTNGNVDVSYVHTDNGDKGTVRLRKPTG